MTIVSYFTDQISNAKAQDYRDFKKSWFTDSPTIDTYAPYGKGPGRPITWGLPLKTVRPVTTGVMYPQRAYYAARRGGKVTFARARTMGRKKNYPAQRSSIPLYRPRTEVKTLTYTSFVSGVTSNVGEIQCVSDMSQGTGSEQRDGNVVKLLDIKFNGTVALPSSTVASARVRIIVLKWMQGYVSPSVAGILVAANIDSSYNQLESRNYKIIYDRYYDLVPKSGVVGAYGADVKSVSFRRNCPLVQTFTATAGNSADQGIWVIVIADVNTAIANIGCQLRFIDV